MPSLAEQLAGATVLDNLQRAEAELAGNWGKWWATTRGEDTATGWTQKSGTKECAALWTPEGFALPAFAIFTLAKLPVSSQWWELMLGKVSGAETYLGLSASYVSATKLKFHLQKAVSGTETVLETVEIEVAEGDRFAFTVEPGAGGMKGWHQAGGTGAFVEFISTTPPSLEAFGSTVGMAIGGSTTTNSRRFTDFAAGVIMSSAVGPPVGSRALLGVGK